jgi:chromosome segregation ATPase
MANQVQIADLNKKHSLAITEKLSQIEVQRKNNEVATK